MSHYQQLLSNHKEIRNNMVSTKNTPDHSIWVTMYRWSLDEIKRHSLMEQQSA